jgi:hypothetical protein
MDGSTCSWTCKTKGTAVLDSYKFDSCRATQFKQQRMSTGHLTRNTFEIFLVWPLLPTHWVCRRLLLRLIILSHKHKHTLGWGPLDGRSARRRGLYMYNKQYSQLTDTQARGWIQTNDTSNPKLEKKTGNTSQAVSKIYRIEEDWMFGSCVTESISSKPLPRPSLPTHLTPQADPHLHKLHAT